MAPTPPPGAKVKGKKLGPLTQKQWIILLAALVGAYLLYKRFTSTAGQPAGQSVGSDQAATDGSGIGSGGGSAGTGGDTGGVGSGGDDLASILSGNSDSLSSIEAQLDYLTSRTSVGSFTGTTATAKKESTGGKLAPQPSGLPPIYKYGIPAGVDPSTIHRLANGAVTFVGPGGQSTLEIAAPGKSAYRVGPAPGAHPTQHTTTAPRQSTKPAQHAQHEVIHNPPPKKKAAKK